MAHLSLQNHPIPAVTADPGRQEVTLHAHPVRLVMRTDEARRLVDELGAALAGLAVKDSDVAWSDIAEAGLGALDHG